MMYYVHNLQAEHRDDNWIRYWENATGLDRGKCHHLGCNEDATDGAHVTLKNSDDKRWYIVPLCHECNCQFGADIWVEGPLVAATDPTVILK